MNTIKTFNEPGDFASSRAAEQWLRDRNFSFGPSQADGPQAIWHGACDVSKWRNLSKQEQRDAHGILESSRNGPATITLRASAPLEAQAAFCMMGDDMAILRHMLGATSRSDSDTWGSRNHYLANRRDVASLEQLVFAGMVRAGAPLLGLRYYHATQWGCEVVGLSDTGIKSALAIVNWCSHLAT